MLEIKDVWARIQDKDILKGLDLSIPSGEIHVLMGPNGVGKSTLGHVLMASPTYAQTQGHILLDNEDITSLDTSARAQKGLFLAFQYPVSVPGLKMSEYLRNLYSLRHQKQVNVSEFRKILQSKLDMLRIERSVLSRYLNDGFSGGEMKRLEMLQLMILEPKVAFLDEIDSGLDVDAQKIIADSIKHVATQSGTSFVIVSHYQRLLNFLNPHKIHIILDGKVARSGDFSLASTLEKEGYDWARQQHHGG